MTSITREQRSPAWAAFAASVAAISFSLIGCEPKPVAPPPDVVPVAGESFEATWDRVMAAQANRRRGLEKFVASGPVELRWTDSDGDHWENCRGEIFLRMPDETALSLTKVGERFLWLGSASGRRWLFDLRSRDATLWIVESGAGFDQEGGFVPPAAPRRGGAPLPISQLSLIDLLGLMEFPPFTDLDAVRDDTGLAPRVEFMGQGGPVRVTLDPATGLPRDVEVLADDGSVLVHSAFEAYESVERPGQPPGALPKWPSRVIVTAPRPAGDATPGDEIKLFMTPSPRGDDRVVDRLFDLEALKQTFKPVRIEAPR